MSGYPVGLVGNTYRLVAGACSNLMPTSSTASEKPSEATLIAQREKEKIEKRIFYLKETISGLHDSYSKQITNAKNLQKELLEIEQQCSSSLSKLALNLKQTHGLMMRTIIWLNDYQKKTILFTASYGIETQTEHSSEREKKLQFIQNKRKGLQMEAAHLLMEETELFIDIYQEKHKKFFDSPCPNTAEYLNQVIKDPNLEENFSLKYDKEVSTTIESLKPLTLEEEQQTSTPKEEVDLYEKNKNTYLKLEDITESCKKLISQIENSYNSLGASLSEVIGKKKIGKCIEDDKKYARNFTGMDTFEDSQEVCSSISPIDIASNSIKRVEDSKIRISTLLETQRKTTKKYQELVQDVRERNDLWKKNNEELKKLNKKLEEIKKEIKV